ncbi:MAG: hypothetical protein R3279_00540 [Putridiphycobacter sp.]|nr:hypothetical protein [Putridiphycobacter sp.]
MRYIFFSVTILIILSFGCTNSDDLLLNEKTEKDTVLVGIEAEVNRIIGAKDSLVMVPSLRYAKGETETYMAKMYGQNQLTRWIREEQISNQSILGRDYYYQGGNLILIKDSESIFNGETEEYTERLLYVQDNAIYKALEKHQYTEDNMFLDTLYQAVQISMAELDVEKPYRALQQQGEFAMHFDQFLLIDPQSYLIVENIDKTMNAALFIIEGDSLLNRLYENPEAYKGQKLWIYHSFKEMNGIERTIYEGAVLVKAPTVQ